MKRLWFWLCFALLMVVMTVPSWSGGSSASVKFRSPISDSYFFTAYYDNNSAKGAFKDYLCGTISYDKHEGTDFAAPKYTSIYSTAKGTIDYAEDGNGNGCATCCVGRGCLGNQVRMVHADGSKTYYGHMEKGTLPYVNMCITVNCATLIGKVGTSGMSSGNHLHFQIVKSGYPYDDPYAGKCSGNVSYWTGVTNGKPSTQCMK